VTDAAPLHRAEPGTAATGPADGGHALPGAAHADPADRALVLVGLRAEVAALRPVDDREAGSIRRFLTELDRLAAPLDEHADLVHVTASAIVVGPRGTVLHRHKRLGIWLQPGGHVDPGETPAEAVLREVREETGLALTHAQDGPRLVHVDVHPGGRGHTHLDLRYLLQTGDADLRPAAGESGEVAWFGWEQAIALADPGLRNALVALRP
jgi:8-oxo-dGTP pyrophosphatase MutT (NUDIX family)